MRREGLSREERAKIRIRERIEKSKEPEIKEEEKKENRTREKGKEKRKRKKEEKKTGKPKKKKNKWRPLIMFLLKIVFFGVFLWGIFTFLLGWQRVSDNNMFPMVKEGDFILYYRLDDCYIDDPVVYDLGDGKDRLGRISAIEGQEVNFPEDGGYEVDKTVPGEILPFETYKDEESTVKYPMVLKSGEYFILNDYRTETDDSRKYGAVEKDCIKGKIIFVLRRRSI